MTDQIATRRVRVVKYRGSSHGTNEYPFLIGNDGISVLPITGIGLDYPVSQARVRRGIPALDGMLGGKGYFRGSSVLVSGTAGTGKSSVAASFARRGGTARRAGPLLRARGAGGAGAAQHALHRAATSSRTSPKNDTLRIIAARPTIFGLEQHLVTMHESIEKYRPRSVIVDPISSLIAGGNFHEVKSMLIRLFDYLKTKGITGLFTYLAGPRGLEETDVGVSSLIDTWIELRDLEHAGERNRAVYILKSRGMAHSNQVREFVMSRRGIDLIDAFIGPGGVLIGSARITQAADAQQRIEERREEGARRQREVGRRQQLIAAQIEALRGELAALEEESHSVESQHATTERLIGERWEGMRQSKRGAASSEDRGRRS